MRVGLVVAMSPLLAVAAVAQQSYSYESMPEMRAPVAARKGSAPVTSGLPVRAVSLYKNGVGFFEQAGRVHGDEVVRLNFTTAQLNDVLQSLTAVDLGGGTISRGGYDSAAPVAAQLNAMFPGLGQDPTVLEFYRAIKGRKVEVRSGKGVFTGRVLNVEVRRESGGKDGAVVVERRYLSVVNDAGGVRTIELTPATEVRLTDGGGREIGKYLQGLASSHETEVRQLTLEDRGVGDRELHLSYLSGVPAWKSSYRILYTKSAPGAPQTATLQGWAVVDNASGADWKDVELTLVSGAPQSFIQQISRPLVVPREQIPMPVPGKAPVRALMGRVADPIGASYAAAVPMESQTGGLGGGTEVHRVALGEAQAEAPLKAVSLTSGYEKAAVKSLAPQTTSADLDDLFEYKLSKPITIARNESATVPILQTEIAAERVTVWSPHEELGTHAATPMRALWLTNSSGLTLDSGSFSVVENGMFGGEGQMELLHPKERRLVPYAVDEAVSVDFKEGKKRAPFVVKVNAADGRLSVHRRYSNVREYVVHNVAGSARTVVLEPVRTSHFQLPLERTKIAASWDLAADVPKPAEVTDKLYRFEVPVAAGSSSEFELVETHSHPIAYDLTSMHEDELSGIVKEAAGNAEIVAKLQPILDAMRLRSGFGDKLKANEKAIAGVTMEEKRIRDNMGALKGSEDHGLAKRYSDEMNAQEDKLAALHKEREALEAQHDAAQKMVADLGRALTMKVEIPQTVVASR